MIVLLLTLVLARAAEFESGLTSGPIIKEGPTSVIVLLPLTLEITANRKQPWHGPSLDCQGCC